MLWLVTPVHGRVELTRICLEQRARMLEELALLGVQARQLVVGHDRNVDTALELGFDVIHVPNVLGLRVNAGFEWACREGGADAVAYCGSDDWHLAGYFAQPPAVGTYTTCRWQAFVSPGGDRLAVVEGRCPYGLAPWIVSRDLLGRCNYRPAKDAAPNGVDSSIAAGLADAAELGAAGWDARRAARRAAYVHVEADALRVVDFKGGGEQITPFERAVREGSALDTDAPFEELARVYPADLVERMQRFYAAKGAR